MSERVKNKSKKSAAADIVYTFKRDDFRGEGALQLEVLDLRPAQDRLGAAPLTS